MRGDPFHGAARRVPGAAGPPHRAGRHHGRLLLRGAGPRRAGAGRRLSRQHPGPPGRPVGRPLLHRSRGPYAENLLEAMAYQEVPFERLATELEVERGRARTPLFRTMAILHSQDDGGQGLPRRPGPGVLRRRIPAGQVRPHAGDVAGRRRALPGARLRRRAVRGETVARLAGRFTVLCHAIAADPRRVSPTLPLRTDEDDARLRVHEAAAPPYRLPSCRTSSGRRPPRHAGATAVGCGDETLTYADLECRVASLTALLRHRGVVRETVVGSWRTGRSTSSRHCSPCGAQVAPTCPSTPTPGGAGQDVPVRQRGRPLVTARRLDGPPPGDVPVLVLDDRARRTRSPGRTGRRTASAGTTPRT